MHRIGHTPQVSEYRMALLVSMSLVRLVFLMEQFGILLNFSLEFEVSDHLALFSKWNGCFNKCFFTTQGSVPGTEAPLIYHWVLFANARLFSFPSVLCPCGWLSWPARENDEHTPNRFFW